MSHIHRLDKMSMNIRARLSKPRPVRHARPTKRRVKRNPHATMTELRRLATMGAHRDIDATAATFLYGTVLGHALGSGEISDREYVHLINSSRD